MLEREFIWNPKENKIAKAKEKLKLKLVTLKKHTIQSM